MSASVVYNGILLRLAGPAQTDVVQHAIVLAPVRLYAHLQIEIDPGSEKAFQILPRRRPDALDHVAAAAHDDRLLRLPVDHERAVEAENRLLAACPEQRR